MPLYSTPAENAYCMDRKGEGIRAESLLARSAVLILMLRSCNFLLIPGLLATYRFYPTLRLDLLIFFGAGPNIRLSGGGTKAM